MRWLMPKELSPSNHQRTGEDPREDRLPLGYTTPITTYPLLAWSCLKLEKPHGIGLSGGC